MSTEGPGMTSNGPQPANQMRINIVGGGLNGLTAACRLATAGANVTLYEASQQVGGAARSATCLGMGRSWIWVPRHTRPGSSVRPSAN